jgi:hypothetical protein
MWSLDDPLGWLGFPLDQPPTHLQRLGSIRLAVRRPLHELHSLQDVEGVTGLLGAPHHCRPTSEPHQPRVIRADVGPPHLLTAHT